MRNPQNIHRMRFEQMLDYLDAVTEKILDFVDDSADLDVVLGEEIERAWKRGLLSPQTHQDLYWQLGIKV